MPPPIRTAGPPGHARDRRRFALSAAAAGFTALAACSQAEGSSDDTATAESQQLETAAARLDARAPSPGQADAAALEADVRNRLAAEPE